MPKVKSTTVWKSFLVSFLFSVIGGLIVYLRNKKKNRELAFICLILSIFHPVTFGFVVGFVLGSLMVLVDVSIELIEIYATVLWIPISFVLMLIFMKIFRENRYRYFIPVWYFGLFGAIYSYFYGYKKNKALQEDIIRFFLAQLAITIFIFNPIIRSIDYLTSPSVTQQTSFPVTVETTSLKSYENKTIDIRSGAYYPYSIYLKENQTAKFIINVSGGVINTVLLNSTEYNILTEGGEFYYFVSGYRSGIEETEITFIGPYNDIYYLVLANFPIFEGQAESLGDVRVNLYVYIS